MKKILLTIIACFSIVSLFAQITMIRPDTIEPSYMHAVNGKILYAHRPVDGQFIFELWATDGTNAGSYRVKDINPNSADELFSIFTSSGVQKYASVVFNNELYFLADDGIHGMEFWKSDGTNAGTNLFFETEPGLMGWDFADSKVPGFCVSNGTLFFKSGDASHGYELWKTDGTTAGTVEVSDIYPGATGSNPYFITAFNGKVYFTARDNVHGWELFCSDGTPSGTTLVKDIAPGAAGAFNDGGNLSINPQFKVSGNYLYFLADNNGLLPVEQHWWRTDGTDAGTIQLETTLVPQSTGAYNQYITTADLNGEFIFIATGGTSTSKFWKSDGSVSGTTEVLTNNGLQLRPSIMSIGSYIYFNGSDTDSSGLARSDGSTSGSDLILNYVQAGSSFNVTNPSFMNGNMFFHMSKYYTSPLGAHSRIVQSNGATHIIYPGVEPLSTLVPLGTDLIFYGHDTTEAVPQYTRLYKLHPAPLSPAIGVDVPELSNAEFKIFPNPASEELNILVKDKNLNRSHITIMDINGRVVYSYFENESDIGLISIPLAGDISNGLYFISINSPDFGRITSKLIININK